MNLNNTRRRIVYILGLIFIMNNLNAQQIIEGIHYATGKPVTVKIEDGKIAEIKNTSGNIQIQIHRFISARDFLITRLTVSQAFLLLLVKVILLRKELRKRHVNYGKLVSPRMFQRLPQTARKFWFGILLCWLKISTIKI